MPRRRMMPWRRTCLLLLFLWPLVVWLQLFHGIIHQYSKSPARSPNADAPPLLSPSPTAAVARTAANSSSALAKQRVVLLAGPHKTGSTSIQANLMNWLGEGGHPSNLAATWAWPSPVQQFIKDGNGDCIEPYGTQVFYWWLMAMYGTELRINCMQAKNGTRLYQREQFIEFYRREFYDQWMKGKSLVIATEAMDKTKTNELVEPTGALDKEVRYDRVDAIIKQLPWNTEYSPAARGAIEDITVVVVYRSPRVEHLKSTWHQCCVRKNKVLMSFYEYLAGPDAPLSAKHSGYPITGKYPLSQ